MNIAVHKIDITSLSVDDLVRDIRVAEWGDWARTGGSDLGYPPCLIGRTPSGKTPDITDADAMKVDRKVSRLPPQEKVVIMFLYQHRRPVMLTAVKLNQSRETIRALRYSGLKLLKEMKD